MGDVAYKTACPRCRKNGKDFSGDNLTVYTDNSKHCFACGYTVPSKAYLLSIGADIDYDEDEQEELVVTQKEIISLEEIEKLKGYTSEKGNGYRGIRDDIYKTYIVRHQYDEGSGDLVAQYYPVTQDYKASGYKIRYVPKDFKSLGRTGKDCDLFGQWRFKNSTARYVVICAGEIDAMSAFQMLSDYSKQKGSEYEATPCVSATIGESGSDKQIQKHYQWLDRFERIIVCYDNDEAGHEALKKVVAVLPRGKAYIMEIALKDTNEYLEQGRQKEWINAFYRAKRYVPDGITASTDLEKKMEEYVAMERISLPKFMYKMQSMLRGGLPVGYIVNLLSASGTGKSTIVDAMILHWIMNDNRTVGIVALEASEGEYGVNLTSAYQGFKLNLLETAQERVEWLQDETNKQLRKELWEREDGSPRFFLVDADVDTMKSKIEYLIRGLGCQIIVLDPLQDVFDDLDEDQQAKWMKWEKDIVKREKVTIININHSRKSARGQKALSNGGELNEEDMMGHSSIYKSGGVNIVVMRDKEAEDPIERNTTYAKITKARGVGNTGPAGTFYYDNNTHTMYDKEYYFEKVKPASF